MILGLGISQIIGWGSTFYLPAVLSAPIAADTGWPLAGITLGFSLALLISGLAAPKVGELIQQFGGRRVMPVGFVLAGAGQIALAIAPGLPVLIAAWALIGLGMSACLYEAAFSSLGRLFGSEARRAITTLTLFGGFASTVCWPLAAFLIEQYGWRAATATLGVVNLLVCAPLLVRALPREQEKPVPGAGSRSHADLALSPAQRRMLAILTAILVLGGVTFAIVSVHLLTLLQGRGISLAEAVAIGALIGPAQVGGRLVEMAFGYRFHSLWTLIAAVTLIATGIGLLALDLAFPALALILYGAGNGIWSIAKGTVPLALFGSDNFPIVIGRLTRPALVCQAAAPVFAGWLLTRDFDALAIVLACMTIGNLALTAMLWRSARTHPR